MLIMERFNVHFYTMDSKHYPLGNLSGLTVLCSTWGARPFPGDVMRNRRERKTANPVSNQADT
jgi:hypothetical protein